MCLMSLVDTSQMWLALSLLSRPLLPFMMIIHDEQLQIYCGQHQSQGALSQSAQQRSKCTECAAKSRVVRRVGWFSLTNVSNVDNIETFLAFFGFVLAKKVAAGLQLQETGFTSGKSKWKVYSKERRRHNQTLTKHILTCVVDYQYLIW